MSPRLTLATADRVLRQIRHDPRTIGLLVVVPCVLMGLLAWIYQNTPVFDSVGAWALKHGVGHHPETSMPWSER